MFNINTILTKKVQIYFEVMINYIIALTSHVRRNNLMTFCSCQLSQWWYYYCQEFILDWLCLHSWTQALCIKQGVSDLHLAQFSSCHAIPPQFLSVKADGQQMWVRQKEFVHVLHLTELSSSSLLNFVASPKNLPFRYCVAAPVRPFDQQRSWWSYNDSTTLTYLVFHWQKNQTKHHNWILSLLKQLHVSSPLLHYITIHVIASMTLPHFMYFIKYSLDFCKVRIKLLGLTFKGKQSIFPNQQSSSSSSTIALLHLYYRATMMPIAIQSQQEPLICMVTQQGSLAVVQVVVSLLLSLLIYTFQVWESVNEST